jgi:hypothetical protein
MPGDDGEADPRLEATTLQLTNVAQLVMPDRLEGDDARGIDRSRPIFAARAKTWA